MKKRKTIFILVGIVLALLAILISYLVINANNQEKILKKEIEVLIAMDLLNDDYNIKIKTKGEYAYVEKKLKVYFKELSDDVKEINSYLTNEQLINILSIDNLKNDGPQFVETYQLLENVKNNSNVAMDSIKNMSNKDTFKKLIKKEKINKNLYQLYVDLINEENLTKLDLVKNETEVINTNLNIFLDKAKVIIDLLKNNSDYWFIDDSELYFETNNLLSQYNNLQTDINNFAKENFSK